MPLCSFRYGNSDMITEQARVFQTKPMIVHCSSGVAQTGVAIAALIGIDRLRGEGQVNVFSIIRHLRTQCASIVQKVAQYEFVYKILAAHAMNPNGAGSTLKVDRIDGKRGSIRLVAGQNDEQLHDHNNTSTTDEPGDTPPLPRKDAWSGGKAPPNSSKFLVCLGVIALFGRW